MRIRTRWINLAAALLLVGCESHPLAPDDSTFTQPRASRQDAASASVALEAPRWLTLRPDGMYDDQGRRRLSRGKVNALHIDQAFELHRQAKLQWMNQRAPNSKSHHANPVGPGTNAPAPVANSLLSTRPSIVAAPGKPVWAVAADDPCFFDATVWCENEYGGEIGGGGSGGGGGDSGSFDCGFLKTQMANSWGAYTAAQASYIEMVGWVTDAPFSSGVIEGALSVQYSKMQSYLADYNVWRGLATRYRCS